MRDASPGPAARLPDTLIQLTPVGAASALAACGVECEGLVGPG